MEKHALHPSLFDRLPDPIILLNPDRLIVTLNQSAVELLETPASRAAGHRIEEFIPGLSQLTDDSIRGGQARLVIDWITSDQQRRYEVVVSAWNNHQDELAGYLYTFHDLTFLEKNALVLYQQQQEITSQRIRQLNQTLARLETEYNLFAMVMDTINVLVAMLDSDGKIERYNRAFEVGISAERKKLQGEIIWNLLYFDVNDRPMSETIHTLREFLEVNSKETFLIDEDGIRRIIVWSSQVYTGEDQAIERVIVTGIDITAQKKMEDLLAREQLLLRSLINSIPDLIFYKDTLGRYIGCNLAFEKFSQHSGGRSIVGHTDYDFYPAEVAEKFQITDNQVMTNREPVIYENQILRPNGKTITLETRKSPYYGPHQEILGVIGIGRDITQHKMDEEALRQANAEIAQLIASLSSILIVVTIDQIIQHWNPSAQRILGISSDHAVGKHLSDLPINWDRAAIDRFIEKCKKERSPQYLDPMRFARTNGSEGYLGINISPIYDQENSIAGFILLGSDITERKALENQVAQGQKLKSIGQLAAGIAHEINTPIQYIGDNAHFLQTSFQDLMVVFNMYTQLGEAVKLGRPTTVQVNEIETAIKKIDLPFLISEIPLAIEQSLDGIQRVSEIVRSMKEFSHPGVTHKTAFNINKGLQSTITVARNEWKYVADVETDLSPNMPSVYCLPGEINQVFLNIIINAAHAIGEKIQKSGGQKGNITITTRSENDWVEIRIKDNGPGIPEHVRQHIFEPFFTTKEVGKGTGQGLAIAYNVVEVKHGGKLSFESRIGEGTTFIIRLPVNQANSPNPE